MEIHTIRTAYFSPTRTTATILDRVAAALSADAIVPVDLTCATETDPPATGPEDLVLFGAPVYAGRIPPVAAERLTRVKGNNTPAVVVVLYGNREFEDALLELSRMVADNGFVPVAAAAFIGEHSYSTDETPIAKSRPDAADLAVADNFARQIREKLAGLDALTDANVPDIPGNIPYKEFHVREVGTPETLTSACTGCGECAAACPVGAIDDCDPWETDPDTCIHCCACIKICPESARVFEDPRLAAVQEWLFTNFSDRKEPVLFL